MTHTADHSIHAQGMFRRALAAVWAFLEALESGGSGYTLDRIERLEGEVRRLQEDLRQSRKPGPIAAHTKTAAAFKH